MKNNNRLPEVKIERITQERGDEDAWVCVCGNTPTGDGFYPCDREGNEVEPIAGSNWENLYVCAQCGRIISVNTLEVVGQNPKPEFLP